MGNEYVQARWERRMLMDTVRKVLLLTEVVGPNLCWRYTGHLSGGHGKPGCGYAHVRHRGRMVRGHRLVYEAFSGPIPDGLQIDHLCGNPWCVRPDHLEAVTKKENLLRATARRRTRRDNEVWVKELTGMSSDEADAIYVQAQREHWFAS